MIDSASASSCFRSSFSKALFLELLRYSSSYMDCDLWLDVSSERVFFTGSDLRYLKQIYEAKGIVYLFTFRRLNADQCIRIQIPYNAFTSLIDSFLLHIDFSIEVDFRYIDNATINLYRD